MGHRDLPVPNESFATRPTGRHRLDPCVGSDLLFSVDDSRGGPMRGAVRHRGHWMVVCCAVSAGLLAATGPVAEAAPAPVYSPGAPGAGDPYFPDMGNGGYDV